MQPSNDAPIHLVPYDEAWPSQFERERDVLSSLLKPWLAGTIEHVGSTAVPGLTAKPVIDIMAGVSTLEQSRPAIEALRNAGYQYAPYRTDVMHWFCKPDLSFRTHHLHLIPFESQLWHDRIAFRECLRTNNAAAGEYVALKRTLADKHRIDREAYTEGKTTFVQRILREALALGELGRS